MKTITFYSYKGGVGRSLALANIASHLTKYNKQVCLLDFDLEAPGLHFKFADQLKNQRRGIDKGIVDYIYEFSNTGIIPDRISEFSLSFLSTAQAYITLIPAGNINSPDYWKKLSNINWYNLLYGSSAGLYFLLDLKQKIQKELSPDYLLIDSRTGITEMSGITLSLLADTVVVIAANNKENIEGAKKVIKSISDPINSIVGKPPEVHFVLSRVPFGDTSPEDKGKEQNLIAKIKREFEGRIDDILVLHSDRDLEENEQIKIGFSKGDLVAPISRDYIRLFDKLIQKDLREDDINRFDIVREGERLYQKAQTEPVWSNKLKYIDQAINQTTFHEANTNFYNTEFLLYRISIYEKLGDWKKVIENCDLVIAQDTSNVLAYESRGWAQLKMNDHDAAKSTFDDILDTHKNRISAKLGLADILTLEKNYEGARAYYNEVIRADLENPAGYVGRAKIELLMGEIKPALEDTYQALMLNADYAEAFLTLAEINAQRQDFNEFYLNFEKALKLDQLLVISALLQKEFYLQFLTDSRFVKIMEKYSIDVDLNKNELPRF